MPQHPHQTTEDAILQEQLAERELKSLGQRAAVLRVYNYYRIILSFSLLILFYEVPDQSFVGTYEPAAFQNIILIYLIFNVGAGFYCLLRDAAAVKTSLIIAVTLIDLALLTAIMITSGGVQSGLDSLLIFAAAFGGVMIYGQISYLFPFTATLLCLMSALYSWMTDVEESTTYFFEVALVAVAAFAVNALLQYVSELLKRQEMEVVSLATLERMREIAEISRNELEEQYNRFNVLLSATSEGVLGIDLHGTIIFANPRAGELLGVGEDGLIHRDVQDFMVKNNLAEERPAFFDMLDVIPRANYDPERWRTDHGEPFIVDIRGEETLNKNSKRTGAVLIFKNITEERQKEERLRYLSNHDALTDLPNRAHFHDLLVNGISRSDRSDRYTTVVIVDLDHFTVINEKSGQQTGDWILKEAARRLTTTIRKGDQVARLGGDQFGIMLIDMESVEDASIVAEKIIEEIGRPLNVPNGPETISASIGIATTSDDVGEADELIAAAISAVETAKAMGRNQYAFFEPDIQTKVEEKKRIQIMLRDAIDKNEFKLMFQPIVDIQAGRIASAEALIRWFPEGGDPIRPDIFIPIAEESGQINNVGAWVIETVMKQAKTWREQVSDCPAIAVNISSKQLSTDEFRNQFIGMLDQYDIAVQNVELELTETGVMADPEKCLEELGHLKQLGVSISIDDFGTGYSSLDYLRRLPLDILKIDQSFTRGIGESENDEEIVRVMIGMAHAMGLKVICEGVETADHLRFLQEHNCDYVQGYFFSRPQDPEDITRMIIRESEGSFNIMDVDV